MRRIIRFIATAFTALALLGSPAAVAAGFDAPMGEGQCPLLAHY